MDVGGWLRNLGLGKYEAVFRDHAIDEQVLRHLTGEDLKEIGVATVGDRRKLLAAAAELAATESRPPPIAAARPKSTEVPAERRPITVLFCDLVGSTAISATLDAEDWRNLVSAYLDAASEAVTQMGGRVAKKLGDGLMALFGHPVAQENDSERAVRAALAIQRALAELNRENAGSGRPELLARIGVDSGAVVVDAAGEIFGDAPNIAARVQASAEPGTVVITARVQRQVAGLFVAEDRGAHALKGAPTPVALYRVVRASGGRRFGARTLTPLVGREEELDLLRRRWERAVRGEGQLALVVGEPGIGKSRLVEEFRLKLGETPHTWAEFSSSQLLRNTALHPIAEWGRQRFGDADTPAGQRLADLENTLQLIGLDPAKHAPLIAPLVEIPLPPGRAANLPPEELRRRQLAALIAWFLAGARAQPVALAFEDLHWLDPTSLDLMQALAERGRTAPLFIIATARPEFRPPWSLRSHHSVISLSPLDRADVAQMVGELAARHALSKEVIEGVSERTGGVPLYVEEVARLLLERGEAGGLQAIPPTLQQSLAARLDRLGEAREVAQIGSVLGRDFAYLLLRAVGGVDDSALQSALDRLVGADLLIAEGAGQEANYRFKHALIQDAAYDSLLKSRRRALHRRAAEILCDSTERAAAEPEVIAHHFTQAGLDDLAIEWWGKAGDQALRRSAFQEAIAHLGKAIAMADKGDGPASGPNAGDAIVSRQRVKLQAGYSEAVMYHKGFSAEETRLAWARAAELGAKRDDFSESSTVRHGQWTLAIVRGELRSAQELASTFLREAEDAGRVVEAGVARRSLGIICYYSGDFLNARIHCERALDECRHEHDLETRERFSDDTGAVAMSVLAITSWQLGEVERANELINMANHRAAELGHAPSKVHPLYWKSILEILRGDAAAALIMAKALENLCREHGMGEWGTVAEMAVGWAHGRLADPTAGAAEMRQALAVLINKGGRLLVAFFQGLLADLELETLGADSAVARIDEALVSADQATNFASLPFLHRLRGDILLKRTPPDMVPAEDAYRTAIAVAKQQAARSYELLASLSLAKLYQSTGRPTEAHTVLVPALEGFAPTPEMPEIAQAQALVAALAKIKPVREALERRQARGKMHLDYARAVQWAKGWGSEEARAAVERAHEFAAPTPGHPDYWSLAYGRFAVALLRGEFRAALEIAETYLRQAEVEGRPDHAVNARRLLGTVKLELGAFFESRQEFEKLLENWDEDRDKSLRAVTGADVLCVGWAYMAQLMVILGKVDDALSMSERSIRRAESLGDFGSLAFASGLSLFVLAMCGRNEATLRRAEAFEANASEKGARLWESISKEWASWARGLITGDAAGAATELRDISAARRERQERQSAYMGHGVLAQLQGKAGAIDAALASIAEGFALAEQTGGHRADSFLHRVRGDVLAERNPVAAEAAYREALRIAQAQGARTFELQAAHALARLLTAAGRFADAYTVLAPALEGFSPTPEMPEIAEAQALLATLAETDEVKAAEAQRQRRLHLQTSYGQAMMYSRGFAAEETKAAFARASELAAKSDDFSQRFAAAHGQWTVALVRGELKSAREMASAFLRDAESEGHLVETGVTRRGLALICYLVGDFADARTNCERALAVCEPERDREARERFSEDTACLAMSILATTSWQLGQVERARELIEMANRRAAELGHAPSMAHPLQWKFSLELLLGDAAAALTTAQALVALGREHGMAHWLADAELFAVWARCRLHDPTAKAALTASQGARSRGWFSSALLAELEFQTHGAESALAHVDEALVLARRVEQHCNLPFAHLLRGDILLKRDAADPVPAEEAYRDAIAIAQQQGARSWGLRAALSLAKLYQSTGRPADAHAFLAPALEGFSPTPKMPEIAEAQALLLRLA
jgi:class 3 adenylate cyclase/predicted ATPase